MKTVISFFFFCLLSIVGYSQTAFQNGFKEGYRNGYCYQDYSCISPVPPITPITRVGENPNSYQDGYNRGFEMGRDDKLKSNSSENAPLNSTFKIPDTPEMPNYENDLPFEEMLNALTRRQALYDYNFEYCQSLLDWINILRKQTNDEQVVIGLNIAESTLRSYIKRDVSLLSDNIKSVERTLKKTIEDYNNRLAERENPETYWKSGVDNIEKGEYSIALKDFTKVISLAPNFSPAYLYRGLCFFKQMNWTEAETDFTLYIEREDTTNRLMVHSYRGWARYYQDKFLLAIADFNLILDKSTDAGAYFGRGTSKSGLGDFYGAIMDYDKSIALNENHSMVHNNRGWAKFKLKKYSEALIDANKSVQIDPTNYIAIDSRSEIKLALKDYKGAIEDCTKAIQLNPKLGNSYFVRAKSKLNIGNKLGACGDFSKAGELGVVEAYGYIRKNCNK